ncbi:hypothetical protein GGS23DRAFT_596451 [Durotheca rogersii]|uniref:uncharacterized protein n=1 Tax=Durotheca rogersii TaxID=419775 RepID=UPI00221E37B6|nr:uncharacterized protein GGS23DRAFT_596451 [Durotheca rogersii]KAI5863965.1 hypothetical protein GGS23DRAFT_596451 [Durotheca rogersii]
MVSGGLGGPALGGTQGQTTPSNPLQHPRVGQLRDETMHSPGGLPRRRIQPGGPQPGRRASSTPSPAAGISTSAGPSTYIQAPPPQVPLASETYPPPTEVSRYFNTRPTPTATSAPQPESQGRGKGKGIEINVPDPDPESPLNPRPTNRLLDDELETQREIIKQYEAGSRLWTKEGLLAFERHMAGSWSGGVVRIPAYVGMEDYTFHTGANTIYTAEFHGYYALAFPAGYRAPGQPYSAMTIKVAPDFDYPHSRYPEAELENFRAAVTKFESHPLGHQLYSLFMRTPFPPDIRKIEQEVWHSMFLHAAALMMRDRLSSRFPNEVAIYVQDWRYRRGCVDVLGRMGFVVTGRYGAGAFAEIDEHTLVFAPKPKTCVREIVADLAEPATMPAAMFWSTVLSPED